MTRSASTICRNPSAAKCNLPDIFPEKFRERTRSPGSRKKYGIKADDKLVLVTTGGGGDGHSVMHHFLAMLEETPHHPAF